MLTAGWRSHKNVDAGWRSHKNVVDHNATHNAYHNDPTKLKDIDSEIARLKFHSTHSKFNF